MALSGPDRWMSSSPARRVVILLPLVVALDLIVVLALGLLPLDSIAGLRCEAVLRGGEPKPVPGLSPLISIRQGPLCSSAKSGRILVMLGVGVAILLVGSGAVLAPADRLERALVRREEDDEADRQAEEAWRLEREREAEAREARSREERAAAERAVEARAQAEADRKADRVARARAARMRARAEAGTAPAKKARKPAKKTGKAPSKKVAKAGAKAVARKVAKAGTKAPARKVAKVGTKAVARKVTKVGATPARKVTRAGTRAPAKKVVSRPALATGTGPSPTAAAELTEVDAVADDATQAPPELPPVPSTSEAPASVPPTAVSSRAVSSRAVSSRGTRVRRAGTTRTRSEPVEPEVQEPVAGPDDRASEPTTEMPIVEV